MGNLTLDHKEWHVVFVQDVDHVSGVQENDRHLCKSCLVGRFISGRTFCLGSDSLAAIDDDISYVNNKQNHVGRRDDQRPIYQGCWHPSSTWKDG